MATTRYCLECGYSRQGLPQDALCPECGKTDVFENQRDVCTKLAARPLALLWRVMTLRRLPKGWWVVLETEPRGRLKPYRMVIAGILMLLAFGALSLFVRAESITTSFLYDVNDPQQSLITETGVRFDRHLLMTMGPASDLQYMLTPVQIVGPNLRTGQHRTTRFLFGRDLSRPGLDVRFMANLLAFTIAFWLLGRFVWLPLITTDRRALGYRGAARHTGVIYVAHSLWLIGVAVTAFLAKVTVSLISTASFDWITFPGAILLVVTMIFGPAVIWWRVMSTDTLRQEFPRRIWAVVLLIACILASLIPLRVVFVWPRLQFDYPLSSGFPRATGGACRY